MMVDIYKGMGLKGVPRGTVKELRVFAYHFAHIEVGGHTSVGVESSWDIKRILGTVPVEDDGSARFTIPANTPVSVQPLDSKGRALQLMRSWFVGMPGEQVTCTGCHEQHNAAAPNLQTKAALKAPSEIKPWYGPARPFSYKYEVQPILDKHCVTCHDGTNKSRPNFKRPEHKTKAYSEITYKEDSAYMAIHPYVRRPGPESDIHMLKPMEYHASTSELIQKLQKGHHNVKLDKESWQKLYAWIDFNVPYRGKWAPAEWRENDQDKRRRELAKCYANVDTDPESEYDRLAKAHERRPEVKQIVPSPIRQIEYTPPTLANWPLQDNMVQQQKRTLALGDGVKLELVLIPAGEFIMGNNKANVDEKPMAKVRINKPFWMGTFEITNEQFAKFDSSHDSRYYDMQGKDHKVPGFPANEPTQPVIRISWNQAMDFCQWLTQKTGMKVTLPSEAQWEWACRAGTDTEFWYGGEEVDFGAFANMADNTKKLPPYKGLVSTEAYKTKSGIPFLPKASNVEDGYLVTASVGSFKPNPWGLYDIHGNVAEWTRSTYTDYPYAANDGRNDITKPGKRVVRGGSWRERPKRATSSFRLAYEPFQPVFNVGFRVIVEFKGKQILAKSAVK
jgi:formylglycine-generating enzyme required for sulfatase activity